MDFETFRENLARDIKETLEARTGTDFGVEHRTAEKVNGNYEAILVKPADGEVGVSLNASNLYRDYESGVWVGKEAGIMKRLLYWVKKCIMGHNKFCKHFCVTCEYYEICHIDGKLS